MDKVWKVGYKLLPSRISFIVVAHVMPRYAQLKDGHIEIASMFLKRKC